MYYVLAGEVLAVEDESDVWPPHPHSDNRQYNLFLTL